MTVHVIPSPAEGEGPHNYLPASLRQGNAARGWVFAARKQTGIAVVRSLALCAARDDNFWASSQNE
jgi:hypothetical protein